MAGPTLTRDLWLYVQGLKNPRLKPFQLSGIPLRLKVAPGESPYLNAIDKTGHKKQTAHVIELLGKGKSIRSIAEDLHMSTIRFGRSGMSSAKTRG